LADYRSALYRSFDEGATWQKRYVFPGRILEISVLSNDTLIAHVGRGSFTLWRSDDGGGSWAQTFVFPSGYRTLGPHSVTDDHGYVYVGSYCGCSTAANTNWVWRSGDDGRTWQVVQKTTTHRHIHFVRANPYDGKVYVGFGDSQAGSGIDVSSNHGATWRTLCNGHVCKAVDIDFDPAGFAVYGMDVTNAIPYIRKLNLTTGTTTIVGQLSCPSFSSINLGAGVWLLGEARTGSGTVCSKADNRTYLWGSDDRGSAFTKVYSRINASASGSNLMTVNFVFPSGNFPIQVTGYGTIVARLN
jgi:hypothetical protein